MIERSHTQISIRRQCALLGLNRSSLYYLPAEETEENLRLMRLIDQQYTRTPFYGSRRMTNWLRREGIGVNRKRVQRLMQKMGLEAVYPRPRLSQARPEHKVYPYLLRGMEIRHPDQVWSTDITYVPMRQGFMYLVAVMDWQSRYVLSWQLSNTMDVGFCLEALEEASGVDGGAVKPMSSGGLPNPWLLFSGLAIVGLVLVRWVPAHRARHRDEG